ncbi:18718_t:CDS:2 [Funneliformis geosporum]|uniref:18718_t:CDS:1 n=1 Tax=Funneliformis geosporum TaxID=1117311 RepID=A0A9W4SK54_9GLOM|nr:18718_t:CDS:2 [Funneliformis geosporum]
MDKRGLTKGYFGEFFYLNFEDNPNTPLWVNLTSQVMLPLTVMHTSSLGGVNQDSIFIIGGLPGLAKTNLVYQYDTVSNVLSLPVIEGIDPIKRALTNSVSYEGKIYILGGLYFDANDKIKSANSLDILDTINLSWDVGSVIDAPIGRYSYTATLVNGVIFYIAGLNAQGLFVPLTQIHQYDILSNTWSLKPAAGPIIPGPRLGHSAVLYDGNIVIYGGEEVDDPAKETIAMLDTVTLGWTIPKVNDPNLPTLTYHSAGSPTSGTVTPTHTDKIPFPSSLTSTPRKTLIVGISIGLVAAFLIMVVISAFIYRRTKNKQNDRNNPNIPNNPNNQFQNQTFYQNNLNNHPPSMYSNLPPQQQFVQSHQDLHQFNPPNQRQLNQNDNYSPTQQNYPPNQQHDVSSVIPLSFQPQQQNQNNYYPNPPQTYASGQDYPNLLPQQGGFSQHPPTPGQEHSNFSTPQPPPQDYSQHSSPGQEFSTLPMSEQQRFSQIPSPGNDDSFASNYKVHEQQQPYY